MNQWSTAYSDLLHHAFPDAMTQFPNGSVLQLIFGSSCLEALISRSGRPSFRVPCNEAICGLRQQPRMHVRRPVSFAFCVHSKIVPS